MKQGIKAFLGMGFDMDGGKDFRTQREARDEAHRIVGFTQAQEQLRHILAQCRSATARELAETPYHPQAITPMKGPGDIRLWVPPELPVRRR